MSPSKNQRPKSAFTLIELLVVIAIIGLLATLSVIALNNARAKSRDAKRLADAKQFQTAMELYFNAAGRYPSVAEFNSGKIEYNTGNGTTTYMQVIPSAPTPADGTCDETTNAYTYNAPADGSTYSISFCVAQASPDLGGGELTVWSGGISGGNGGNGGGGGPTVNACNNETSFTDIRDGNNYQITSINGECWMAENLKYIPNVVSSATGSYTAPYYYVYNYDGTDLSEAQLTQSYLDYGVLYNWPAAMNGSLDLGAQGVCPIGWHLPTDSDFISLSESITPGSYAPYFDFVGNFGDFSDFGGEWPASVSDKLRAVGTDYWSNPNSGTDSFGFKALPSGFRGNGYFSGSNSRDIFWTSTVYSGDMAPWSFTSGAWGFNLDKTSAYRYPEQRDGGCSVRCIMD